MHQRTFWKGLAKSASNIRKGLELKTVSQGKGLNRLAESNLSGTKVVNDAEHDSRQHVSTKAFANRELKVHVRVVAVALNFKKDGSLA